MSLAAIAIMPAVVLPWLLGALVARILIGGGRPKSLYAAYGYLLGALGIVWLTKTWHAAGWSLAFWPMTTVIAFLCLAAGGAVYFQAKQSPPNPLASLATEEPVPAWQHLICILLGLAILAHIIGVTQELLLRPTFPWDAWRGWEPKTIQFFATRGLEAPVHTIANYGEISTLVHLWLMLATGDTHQPILHLPWLLAYIALAAGVFGHLRQDHSLLAALLGAYLVASLPYLNIHVALAGYADLWLALAFTLGLLVLVDYRRERRPALLLLAMLCALASLQSKRAGLVFSAILVAVALLVLSHRSKMARLLLAGVILTAIGIVLAILGGYLSLQFPLSDDRKLLISATEFRVTGLISYSIEPEWRIGPFIESFAQFSNWHLASYLWLGLMLTALLQRKWKPLRSPENMGVILGMVVLIAFFTLADPQAAADHTGLSRAALCLMPAAVVAVIRMAALLLRTSDMPRANDEKAFTRQLRDRGS